MTFRICLALLIFFLVSPLTASEPTFELELSAARYQRFITGLNKEGLALTEVSVFPGQRFEEFAVIAAKAPDQKDWKAHHGLNIGQLDQKLKQYAAEGFQPVDISGYERRGSARYAVIWQKGAAPDFVLKHSLDDESLKETLEALKAKGYAPLVLDGFLLRNKASHAGIWVKQQENAWEAECNISAERFPKALDNFTSRGYRLEGLCGYSVGGFPFYHALWSKTSGPVWQARFHATVKELKELDQKRRAENLELVYLDGYQVNGQPYFNAIWRKPEESSRSTQMPVWKTTAEIPVSGLYQKELASLDQSITEFLLKHHPPGASVAVSYRGRLVYARGFGYADVEQKQPVQPDSQFRIASLSKPITAVAIMQLIEQGKLNLDTKVFSILKAYRKELASPEVDPRLKDITIQQLLNHTGGWDRKASFDPMFRSVAFARQLGKQPPAGADDVIRVMVKKPLDFSPGEKYAYSNFGYCLLGRIIETVTGQQYEEYVQQTICAPLGMKHTELGKTLLSFRRPDEVRYYSDSVGNTVYSNDTLAEVPRPYGAWYLEAMDSHGGWISSAPDLVRFATAFNLPDQCPILKAPTIAQMFARPSGLAGFDKDGKPKDTYYACGWMVRPIDTAGNANHWHMGALDGTSTLLVRRLDRINWAILFNTHQGADQKRLAGLIDAPIHQWINQIEDWPEKDQFQQD
ncbi:Penicillin-binding protein 4* [Gimesia panareensis]|uniref:Penicillin-binding protein 4 n=1 Tax=Gimesia panareensis TaxID=2527978 RepID=A0A518FM67_9PLAN|nr:serine hydrolase [Gimesia panareensis]QDV17451.1 Penicillin-binding protein 4* [Gimesia panareensis]